MFKVHLHPYSKMSLRDKVRLNICIAKDLADSFGGRKADYLIRLNRKLRMKLAIGSANFSLVREDLNVWYKGFLRLNKNCRLKKIDLKVINTAVPISNGETSLGIYEVDGDTLTIVTTEPGDHLRPLSFDEPGKSSEFFFTKKNSGFETASLSSRIP